MSLLDPDVSTDIEPGNIMFRLKSPPIQVADADLDQSTRIHWRENLFPLRRQVEGMPPNLHAPIYVLNSIPLVEKMSNYMAPSAFSLVLIDFGAGMSELENNLKLLTIEATTFENANDGYRKYAEAYAGVMRPPEVLLGVPISEKSDIWALGCTVSRDFSHVPKMVAKRLLTRPDLQISHSPRLLSYERNRRGRGGYQ